MRVYFSGVAACTITNSIAKTIADYQDPEPFETDKAFAPIEGLCLGFLGSIVPIVGIYRVFLALQDKRYEEVHGRSTIFGNKRWSPYRIPTKYGWTGGATHRKV